MDDQTPYSDFEIRPDESFVKRRPIEGTVVTVLDFRLPDRTFTLLPTLTRALRTHDIHELIITSETDAKPGQSATGAIYVCFFEVDQGSVAITNMTVEIDGQEIGEIVGFDDTHAPNHLNILCRSSTEATGMELHIDTEDSVTIG